MHAKPTFWFIPHTHWEGAVFKTREQYLEMGLPHILMVLNLLRQHPNYRFVLDQAAYVKPFLERYPEEVAAFRQFVAEGRLQVVGGSNVMNDCNLPGGETTVRQIQYGKGFLREALGVDATIWWAVDTFGHNAQMPQILKRAGFKSMWFCRGVPHRNLPSEFLWQGLDGTAIAAYWLPLFYGYLYGSPQEIAGFTKFCRERFAGLDPFTRGLQRAGVTGADVVPPEPHVAALVEEFNRRADAPFTLRLGVPADYEAAIAQEGRESTVLRGELNPIFQGAYSSRIELKQWMRSMERLLLTGEQLAAVARWLGAPVDDTALWRAWEPVLFNEAHDLAAGVMTDHVYDDTIRTYGLSKHRADESIDQSWEQIVNHIDTRGDGIPVVVWNTLGWARTDVVEVEVALANDGVRVIDSEGHTLPVQIVESRPGLSARIILLARDVPALGYAVYRVLSGTKPPEGGTTNPVLENEYYRLTFDPATGAITSLVDKADKREVLAGPGNVVTCQEDKGDLWELYEGLNGGSQVAMTRQQPVPQSGQAKFSHEESGQATVRTGPVFSEYHVAHPFGNGKFATTVRLYHGLRRIDIRTQLLNNDKWVRYQALFPTTIKNGRNVQEIPFGAIERPNAIEFPAQNWVDYSDGQHGFAVLNEGLPGNVVTDGTLMLSLLRAHTLGNYGYQGGYEPGMGSESGLQLGKSFTLHYALLPHAGDWRAAQVWRDGWEFNRPLICRKAHVHTGKLPARWGLLTVSHPNVVLSAWKTGPDGSTVLRVYEAAGQATAGVQIKLQTPITAASEADLLEQPTQKVPVNNNTLRFDLGAFEIKTFTLNLKGGQP